MNFPRIVSTRNEMSKSVDFCDMSNLKNKKYFKHLVNPFAI